MKQVKPVTKKRLLNAVLFYLSKYESSTEKIRRLMKRRLLKAKLSGQDIPLQATEWMEQIIADMVSYGYVNDVRYAKNLVEKYQSAGKSMRFISQKLKNEGLDVSLVDLTDLNDIQAAKKLVKKKKLGPFRPQKDRQAFFKKDLAVLARAGFSFETAVDALNENFEEREENNVF